jgi:glycosidase
MTVSFPISLTKLPKPSTDKIYPEKFFHILKDSRKKYSISGNLFSCCGKSVNTNIRAVRKLQKKMLEKNPKKPVKAGDLIAMGLIDEILHYITNLYLDSHEDAFQQLNRVLRSEIGNDKTDALYAGFIQQYPSEEQLALDEGDLKKIALEEQEIVLEELMHIWLSNSNPAFSFANELFDHKKIPEKTGYNQLLSALDRVFNNLPSFGPEKLPLHELLRSPALAHPHSLEDQLQYMRERWGLILGDYLLKILRSLDLLKEEHKLRGDGGPGPVPAHNFHNLMDDIESFSEDKFWMPRVVLMAKSTLVWLDQLSKKYDRSIERLDQIPDKELDALQQQGFTGLWLIGLWERSEASRRIKQSMGNNEAEASAYSLHDYEIADKLGGWSSLENLRERCWQRGIRLASDMVPNHTGIQSDWIFNHPEYFLQTDYPPFPSYSYNSQNLSSNPDFGLYLEDHYYEQTDAAVTFKWTHFPSGQDRYIYHGNDGTHMPWNDTAQLDYLNPEVREAVIQKILHVARNFPIIRFDAAMTLAKKHIQRLWYPQPGHGGDIPSRSEYGLTNEEFAQRIPKEFWREVVDRVAEELPDTLLLAEAFWMMEGYFVRSLGMHRVYNSAFMHMMKNEENRKYRDSIKNTLNFDPEILKRFVNFQNNPDEETAAEQFGTGDKYLGVCTMMCTMPGLPMFGHGQIQGYREKYGMEYTKAKWQENDDQGLVHAHYMRVFPLTRRRYLFAEVQNFWLFDLRGHDGGINENVYAFTNQYGNEHVLVVYNNSYYGAAGTLKESSAVMRRKEDGSRALETTSIAAALELHNSADHYVILKDHNTRMHYLRRSSDIWNYGLYTELQGYTCEVFLDPYEVQAKPGTPYEVLFTRLQGNGVQDLDKELQMIVLEPIHRALYSYLEYGYPLETENSDSEVTPVKGSKTKKNGINSEELARVMATFVDMIQIHAGVDQVDPIPSAPLTVNSDPLEHVLARLLPIREAILEIYHELHIGAPLRWFAAYAETQEEHFDELCLIILKLGESKTNKEIITTLTQWQLCRNFLGIHEYQEIEYLSKERLEFLLAKTSEIFPKIGFYKKLPGIAEMAEYQVERMVNLSAEKASPKRRRQNQKSSSSS